VPAFPCPRRDECISKLRDIATSPALKKHGQTVKAKSCFPSQRVTKDVNVAFLGLLLHAINGVDQALPYNFQHGFQIIHDVPASGVYHSTEHDLSLEEFCEVYNAIMMTNDEWMQES